MSASTTTRPRPGATDVGGSGRPGGSGTVPRPAPGPAPAAEGLYGPRGWTVGAGVWEVLARCRDELRSTAIPAAHGMGPQGLIGDDGAPVDDYTPFHAMGSDGARRLLEVLPPQALEDRQNLAPSLGTLLRACAGGEGRVLLSGYGIGPQRDDERVTVEALWVADPDLQDVEVTEEHGPACRCRELWHAVRDRYELDAEAMPDEIRRTGAAWTGGATGWWLWWD